MMLAILDGTKTVTRRVMTPQPPSEREAIDNGCQEFSFGPAVSKEIKVPPSLEDDGVQLQNLGGAWTHLHRRWATLLQPVDLQSIEE
jgi:hypothetical protein